MIRPATTNDIPAMVALGRLMHEESIYAPYAFDGEKVSNLIAALITTRFGIALVEEQGGVVIGGFIGVIQQHWFGSDTCASDFALFVDPAHRTGMTGLKLIKQYIKTAREKGADQIMLANSTGVEAERVAKLFESLGFKRRGYVFEYANA
jgi:N-acetylglutamate synthase-like GNAT family acetyltransferase